MFFDSTEYCRADGFHCMRGSSITGGGHCARVRSAETAKLRRGKGVDVEDLVLLVDFKVPWLARANTATTKTLGRLESSTPSANPFPMGRGAGG